MLELHDVCTAELSSETVQLFVYMVFNLYRTRLVMLVKLMMIMIMTTMMIRSHRFFCVT